jgi:tRNA G18 (ribose-2'-O)-methylase SpoU
VTCYADDINILGMGDRDVLIVCGIAKHGNIERLIVTALAHNFDPVIVGAPLVKSSTLDKHLDETAVYHRVADIDELAIWLAERGVKDIVGLEICDESQDAGLMNWDTERGRIALMPGNEGTGLNSRQKELCSRFVYIPQYGATVESLNVHVATTIALNLCCQKREKE